MKPRTEVRVSELKNEHNGRNRTYDMRSEDRSATCCHHRYYHLCRKDNNNNLINKRYEQKFFFFRSIQPIQAPHRRLHRRHTCRFFLCCHICRSRRCSVPWAKRPPIRQPLGLDWLALHVVICFKIRIFVVQSTSSRARCVRHGRLWFALKFVSLWCNRYLSQFVKLKTICCDLL